MENQELVKRLKRWQMAKNPCALSLHCRNKLNPHPDVISTLEPKEVDGKVILFCPYCDYTQEEIPKFILHALEAKVVPHSIDIEPSLEEIERGSDMNVKTETKKMIEEMCDDDTPIILRFFRKPIEIIFRRRMRQERDMYRELKKARSLSNAEKISRIKKWQEDSPDMPESPFSQDYNMRCYAMACSNVSFFSKFEPKEINREVLLICPDCGFISEQIPDYVLLAFED